VDSLIEPESLRFFIERKRLKTPDWIDGFVPGEAAACLLIEPVARAARRQATLLAAIEGVGTAIEPTTIWLAEPCAATGLSEAAAAALDQLPDRGQTVRLVISDVNGETYRAKEFGITATRTLSRIPASFSIWHAATRARRRWLSRRASACVPLRRAMRRVTWHCYSVRPTMVFAARSRCGVSHRSVIDECNRRGQQSFCSASRK